jgi:isopentenyl diphosphate isomerase/L-lactate dehydrogenase-like FMN-dependent dehydrogenase
MDNTTAIDKKINDFIYDKPDVAVVILQQFGYDINLKTATLPQITKLVYTALYINQDRDFAEALQNSIANDGENNIIAGIIVAVVGSLVSGIFGGIEGDKNRALQKKLAIAQLAMEEKLSEEKIRAEQETARLNILANTLLEYRKTLQKESTARLKDTWLYVTGLGIGLGILYGVFLIGSKD